MQGLLNHARLTHNLEWGTHEECINACAIPDNDLDTTWGIEVGIGPTGVLPGLRTIFQLAVGAHNIAQPPRLPEGVDNHAQLSEETARNSPFTHLNQTLGLHDETPSLAVFLGKGAIRREIKIWDEHEEIDIETPPPHPHSGSPTHRPWRISSTPKSSHPGLLGAMPEHTKQLHLTQRRTMGSYGTHENRVH